MVKRKVGKNLKGGGCSLFQNPNFAFTWRNTAGNAV